MAMFSTEQCEVDLTLNLGIFGVDHAGYEHD